MTTNLADRIATYVDGLAPPISAAEAIEWPRHTETSRRSHPVLIAAMCAMVLLAGLGAWRWTSSSSTTPGVTSEPATDISGCGHPPELLGCPTVADDASVVLGIPLPDPSALPAGWITQTPRLRFWPAGSLAPGSPQSDIADYRQVWTTAGADLDAPGTSAPYVQLTRGVTTAADSGLPTLSDLIGAAVPASTLEWQSSGIHYRLFSNALSYPELLAIARTLP